MILITKTYQVYYLILLTLFLLYYYVQSQYFTLGDIILSQKTNYTRTIIILYFFKNITKWHFHIEALLT